jgi:hypothetical protein
MDGWPVSPSLSPPQAVNEAAHKIAGAMKN